MTMQQAVLNRRIFYQVLGNTLFATVMNFTLWFAITFFVYLQTHSVLATGVISGLYLIATAGSGFWLGSLVDHHKKKWVMVFSSIASLAFYTLSFALYISTDPAEFSNPASASLWTLVVLVMSGVIAGNIRGIALPTLVTMLIEENKRDKANGLIGSTSGVSFLVTSVISGLLVGFSGMFHALLLAIIIMILSIIHLLFITIPEKGIVHIEGEPSPKKVDIKGTLKVIGRVPGLFALILFTTFNNFLGGVFMALMDAYGLSLMSVQAWGFLWGFLSTGFIIGGLLIAKWGLGKNPLRTLLLVNVIMWVVSSLFTIQASILLLTIGMFIYMCIIPFAEAAEQTILQRVVPFERQGRVFGFAQSVEQAASPLTAFLIGPLTQLIFIPFMTNGAGVDLIGGWFGTGEARGIALVFVITGVIGLAATLIALGSKQYRQLSEHYINNHTTPTPPPVEELTQVA